MSRTVAEVIVDGLAQLGVRQVLGVVGDALNSLTDAIRQTDGLDWIGCRHKEVAAFAASAQSQLTERIGVCMGTVGTELDNPNVVAVATAIGLPRRRTRMSSSRREAGWCSSPGRSPKTARATPVRAV